MDETDRKILDILEENGRASYTDIAEEVGVSEGTVRNRVEQLKEEGVIRNFTVETSEKGSKAVVMVKISTEAVIEEIIADMPERIDLNEVTGDYDMIVEFTRNSNEELNDTLDKIREVEGVEETKTYTVLKSRSL